MINGMYRSIKSIVVEGIRVLKGSDGSKDDDGDTTVWSNALSSSFIEYESDMKHVEPASVPDVISSR
jgi:hypothetical protein